MSIQLTEDKESNVSYIKSIFSILKDISTVLKIIEETIDDRKDSFLFMNPKSQQEEPVPIIRAIQYLQEACRTSIAIEFPEDLKEEYELYRDAFNHLQKTTQLLGFYYCNESFATRKIYDDICHHLLMYDELTCLFVERVNMKLHEWVGVKSILR